MISLHQGGRQFAPASIEQFTWRLADLERELTSAAIFDPVGQVPIAHAEGFEGWMVGQPDLRLIFLAAETCADAERTMALAIARRALMVHGLWGPLGWSDEALVDFALAHWPAPPDTRDLAAVLAGVHEAWALSVEEDGPMYVPPAVLGQLDPTRTGLAMAMLARLSGIPLPWLHEAFARECFLADFSLGDA